MRRVCHSDKLRAHQTAELFAAQISPGEPIEVVAGLNPNDPVEPVADRIKAWKEDVLLVGHLPFMGRLVACLVTGDSGRQIVAFKPGSIVCLERVEEGRWVVNCMLRPEMFGG